MRKVHMDHDVSLNQSTIIHFMSIQFHKCHCCLNTYLSQELIMNARRLHHSI